MAIGEDNICHHIRSLLILWKRASRGLAKNSNKMKTMLASMKQKKQVDNGELAIKASVGMLIAVL